MNIQRYSHTNIKGTSCQHEVGPVTLFVGRNRSSKTARMLGIALAATGKCDVGARRDKLEAIVSKGYDHACSTLGLGDNKVLADWVLDNKRVTSTCEGECGDMLTADAFWKLTGEEKWKVISGLVSSSVNDELMARLKTIAKEGAPSDGPSLAEACQTQLAGLKSSAQAALQNLSASLQPPEPYTGEPLDVLNARRRELESLVYGQKKAREYWDKRPDFDKLIEANHKASQAKSDEYNAALERMSRLQDVRRSVSEWVEQLHNVVASESPIMKQCRTESPQAVLCSKVECLLDEFVEAAMVVSSLTGEEIPSGMLAEKDAITEHVRKELAPHTTPLGVPEQVNLICQEFAKADMILRPEIDEALGAKEFIDHQMTVLGRSVKQLGAEIALLVRDEGQLQEAKRAKPQFEKPMDMAELTVKVQELDALNKQINRASEWPAFEARQKETAQKIAELNKQIETLQAQEVEVRQIRAQMLQASVGTISTEANRLLDAMGLSPLKIVVESKGRFSSLSVEDSAGVDLSAMCGAEKILYGYALLCAIHQASSVPCPIRLIEGAELDAETLTQFLQCLVAMNFRGNTFIATHVKPTKPVEGVTVIEC